MAFSRRKRSFEAHQKRESTAAARWRLRRVRLGQVGGLERFDVETLERRVLLSITPSISGSAVTFTGTGGNSLWLEDVSQDSRVQHYRPDGSSYKRPDLDRDDFGQVQSILVSAISTINVTLGGGASTLYLDDTITTDLFTDSAKLTDNAASSETVSLAGGSNNHTWTINGSNSVQLDSNITIKGAGFLIGSGGTNVFDFTMGASGDSININGGSGSTNALDYSAFPSSTPVTVNLVKPPANLATGTPNLATGTATDTSGISNISVVNGGAGNDTLTAGVGNETLNGGTGSDTFVFDPDLTEGSDEVIESPGTTGGTGTLDFSAAQSAITVDISSTEQQQVDPLGHLNLTLAEDDTIATVIGGAKNNTITCNALDDTITAGAGQATLTAGPGNDTFEFGNNWGNATVVQSGSTTAGEGLDTLDFSKVTTNLTASVNPQSLTSSDADGALNVSTPGTSGTDSVIATDIATLVGGTGSNTLNYSDYYSTSGSGITVDLATGTATTFQRVQNFENVTASNCNDSITGDSNANILIGGAGDDTFSGGGGQDTITGGSGVNTLVENFDANMTLTNTALSETPYETTTSRVETLSNIEIADLTGGTDSNKIDASGFTGLGLQTPLVFLNNGKGVNVSKGTLNITLTNGTTVHVDLSQAVSVGDVLNAIHAASSKLTAILNSSANGFVLTDSSGGNGNLSAASISSLASDLGLAGTGTGGTLDGAKVPAGHAVLSGGTTTPLALLNGGTGVQIGDRGELNLLGSESTQLVSTLNNGNGIRALKNDSPDFQVILTDGTAVDVTLSITPTTTVQELLNEIALPANGRLIVGLDQQLGNAITLQDTKNGGSDIQVVALNNSFAASDLGILKTGAGQYLEGTPITDTSADIAVTLTDGTLLAIDFAGALRTIQDVIAASDAADPAAHGDDQCGRNRPGPARHGWRDRHSPGRRREWLLCGAGAGHHRHGKRQCTAWNEHRQRDTLSG